MCFSGIVVGEEVVGGKNVRIKKLGYVLDPGKQNPPENFFFREKERYLHSSRSKKIGR